MQTLEQIVKCDDIKTWELLHLLWFSCLCNWLWIHLTACSGAFIVELEQVNTSWKELNRCLFSSHDFDMPAWNWRWERWNRVWYMFSWTWDIDLHMLLLTGWVLVLETADYNYARLTLEKLELWIIFRDVGIKERILKFSSSHRRCFSENQSFYSLNKAKIAHDKESLTYNLMVEKIFYYYMYYF